MQNPPQTNNRMHILSRVCNEAQLVEPGYARTFFSALGLRANVGRLVDTDGTVLNTDEMKETVSSFEGPSSERRRPYQVVDGIALIPVSGTLVHKFGHLKPFSGSTGYDGILACLKGAMADESVKAVMLDIDSPGGEAAGCFDCAAAIRKMRDIKPIYGLCYDSMNSAAMAIGSACSERWITQSGRAGSVGVVIAHTSFEGHLENEGIEITLLHSGKHKVDGNPYEKLGEQVRTDIQSRLDESRDKFAALVADHIGISKQAVLDTEARVFTGQEAIDVGFANKLVNGAEAVPLLRDVINSNSIKGASMATSETTSKPAASAANKADKQQSATTSFSQADIDQARAEGAKQERVRCKDILGCEESAGRKQLATHLAFSTEMSVDEAKGMLSASPVEATTLSADSNKIGEQLEVAMKGENVGLQASGDAGELSDDELQEQALLNDYDAVTGTK
tara:strand:- start:19878 stop:21230 length:1353 start_codon:yes stop_codon:yes gene_type:complete